MQMKGSGPLHCAAVMHRSAAACAGAAAPTSALTATAAANNSEVLDKVLIMVSPSYLHGEFVASGLRKFGAGKRPSCSVPRSKVTSQSVSNVQLRKSTWIGGRSKAGIACCAADPSVCTRRGDQAVGRRLTILVASCAFIHGDPQR
jgi:hypothetical protein